MRNIKIETMERELERETPIPKKENLKQTIQKMNNMKKDYSGKGKLNKDTFEKENSEKGQF